MGSSFSQGQVVDAGELLVHSFLLDADHSLCSCPFVCTGRTANFPVPRTISSHLESFISYEEVKQMLEDLNRILRRTHWSIKYNQCGSMMVMLCIMMIPFGLFIGTQLLSLAQSTDTSNDFERYPFSLILSVVPITVFFFFFLFQKRRRRKQLTGYVEQWNRSKANGVSLSFGGGGTVLGKRGAVEVGSATGGDYNTFYMSTWDWTGAMMKGYLHVFVNYQTRYQWCQASGLQFIPPVSLDLQSQAQRLPAGSYLPPPSGSYQPSPAGFVVPQGYTLVPTHTSPV